MCSCTDNDPVRTTPGPYGAPKPDERILCRATKALARQTCRICGQRIRRGQLLYLSRNYRWIEHAGCLAKTRVARV